MTKAVTRLERSQQWLAFTGVKHVEIDDDREASLRGSDFGPAGLCQVSLGPHLVMQEHGPGQSGVVPTLKFIFQQEGIGRIEQLGRVTSVRPGEWCALRKDLPYTLDSDDRSRQLAITLPCEVMPAPRHGFEWWRQARSYLRGPAHILHASAEASLLTSGALCDRERTSVGVQLIDLIRLVLHADEAAHAPDARELKRGAILAFIERNLADPDLNVGSIARELGCSIRTVHKVFEGRAQSVARLVWDWRLDRCRGDLVDPAMVDRSITEIAHSWGFSDSQHFSRAFKARFGNTPRDCRHRALLN